MQSNKVPYEKQIFVCTNDRRAVALGATALGATKPVPVETGSTEFRSPESGSPKPSCGDTQAEAIFTQLRKIAKDRGLHPRIRVAQAKCLGQCNQGTTIMVYPDGVWYSGVRLEDIPALAEKYLSAPSPCA